jgi:hypothetical protein
MSPRSLTVNVDLYTQPTTKSLIGNQDHLASNVTPIKTKTKKRRKQPRKRAQLKQRSAIGESSHSEEQINDINVEEDEEEEDDDENTKIY